MFTMLPRNVPTGITSFNSSNLPKRWLGSWQMIAYAGETQSDQIKEDQL